MIWCHTTLTLINITMRCLAIFSWQKMATTNRRSDVPSPHVSVSSSLRFIAKLNSSFLSLLFLISPTSVFVNGGGNDNGIYNTTTTTVDRSTVEYTANYNMYLPQSKLFCNANHFVNISSQLPPQI